MGFKAKYDGTCCYCQGHRYHAGDIIQTVKTPDGRTLYGAEKCWQRMKVEADMLNREYKEVCRGK